MLKAPLLAIISLVVLLGGVAAAQETNATDPHATNRPPTSAAEAVEAAGQCMVCGVQLDYPDLQGKVRQEIFSTQRGFIAVTTVLDESYFPMWQEFDQDRDAKRVTATKLTGEGQAERLCWYCQATFALESRTDASVERVRSSLGLITLATGSTREATGALHEYAELARNRLALLDEGRFR